MEIRDLLFVGVDLQEKSESEKTPPPHQKPSATIGNIVQNFVYSLFVDVIGRLVLTKRKNAI